MGFLEDLFEKRRILALAFKQNAGLRELISEFYPDNAHFIFELLQNAEDAGATNVKFQLLPDRLIFEHDGTRRFTEPDVDSITGVGESSKRNAPDQIGKFGVGFKSVFEYTDAPEIYSGAFSFRIINLVQPEAIPPKEVGELTRFEFPFGTERKPTSVANSEVLAALEELNPQTLLFLNNIRSIAWQVGKRKGELLREAHSDAHVEVIVVADDEMRSVHWVRFRKPLAATPKHHIAVAYELAFIDKGVSSYDRKKPLHQQMRIQSTSGSVSVYFIAKSETSGLRFHLHGPFVTDKSRASVKESAANQPVFAALATLSAESLHQVRDLGLLTAEFLAVLPNPDDAVSLRYRPIRDAIIAEMREHPLVPTHSRAHLPGKRLFQSRAQIKDLLSPSDLAFLTGRDDEPDWAVGISQRNTLQDKFLDAVVISNWDTEDLIEALSDKGNHNYGHNPDLPSFREWLDSKSPEWNQQLYATLYKLLSDNDDFRGIRDCNLVLLSTGMHVRGQDAYFPTDHGEEDSLFPRVDIRTYSSGTKKTQQSDARSFLAEIGVQEIGERHEIERILKTRYSSNQVAVSDEVHASDIRRFIRYADPKTEVVSLFGRYAIFKRADGLWGKPTEIFLDSPYERTSLSLYFSAFPQGKQKKFMLSDCYANWRVSGIASFAKSLGAQFKLEPESTICQLNPHWHYLSGASGTYYTYTGINSDWCLGGLDALFESPTLDAARLIWQFANSAEPQHWIARYRNSKTHGDRTARSRLLEQLTRIAWVPQEGGGFVRPVDALPDKLPPGFPFDPGRPWIAATQFGKASEIRRVQAAMVAAKGKELGFETSEQLELALECTKISLPELRRLLEDLRLRKLSAEQVELPVRSAANSELRASRMAERARGVPLKQSRSASRTVAVDLEQIKDEARTYLREHYTNPHGVMFCQVCKAELPFKLGDGLHHFEAVEVLRDMPKRFPQTYLALCPNHSARFRLGLEEEESFRDQLADRKVGKVQARLAGVGFEIYFTEAHLSDIRSCLESLKE